MFRMFTTAASLALTVTAAQAGDIGSLSTRVHDAAVAACAPESVSNAGPAGHYGAITEHCINRLSNAAMAKYQAEADAKAARARLANN
jgi:hypothetical protein